MPLKDPEKRRAYDRARSKLRDPEVRRAQSRMDYLKHREARLKKHREWYADNPERHAALVRRWHEENKDKHRELCLRWGREHPEKRRHDCSIRRARKLGVLVERFKGAEVFERDGWHCKLCGHEVLRTWERGNIRSPELDHIIPLSRGGVHSRANTQLLCSRCNNRKATT